ncbi:glycosyltransferase [Priestia flexa]|uniref:glycosyltransferase n=1 Tax=Priestia flexa TaxID=86664 RepID=UPI002491A2C9|nr:glycosyltransferase [Priestia flexa]
MKILHYTLGLPPMRSGGLTKYALDLMNEQTKKYSVVHLFPGAVDFLNKKTRVKPYTKIMNDIAHYEIVNSLPLPLFRGIKTPADFMKSVDKSIYINFLNQIKPDIIHVHTLMGIHKEFFEAANELSIKLVYTTHDYFGFCPTINLYKDHEQVNCSDFEGGRGCAQCCYNSMGTKTLRLSQTSIYSTLKKVKKIKSILNTTKNSVANIDAYVPNKKVSEEYLILRHFYLSLFQHINLFHFNSHIAKNIYEQYIPNIKGEIIDITHSNIQQKIVKKNKSEKIKLGYLGPFKEYKGFSLLVDVFKELPSNKYELHLYGDDQKIELGDNLYSYGRYSINELENIFANIDVLIVPSVWKETFGFIALEALSHGTPVIVSENVGSKDLIDNRFGWIVNEKNILNILKSIDKESLKAKYEKIQAEFQVETISQHVKKIAKELYSLKNSNENIG